MARLRLKDCIRKVRKATGKGLSSKAERFLIAEIEAAKSPESDGLQESKDAVERQIQRIERDIRTVREAMAADDRDRVTRETQAAEQARVLQPAAPAPQQTVTQSPSEAALEEAWLASPEFQQAEEMAAAGDMEGAEALEESFREKQTEAPAAAANASQASQEPPAIDPIWLERGRWQDTSERQIINELRHYSDAERTEIQNGLKAKDNRPETIAKALKALQPKTGGVTTSTYRTESERGVRRDDLDEVTEQEERGAIKFRRQQGVSQNLPIKPTEGDFQKAIDAVKDVLPGVENARFMTRDEIFQDEDIRRQFIAIQRANDPSMTVEEADALFDQKIMDPYHEAFAQGGHTYIISDGVGVTRDDGNAVEAILRLLRHENTHEVIEAAEVDAKLGKEWQDIKGRVSPEKLDELARDRYPHLAGWREDAGKLNNLAHEYFAQQMEHLEKGEQVDDRGLLARFIEWIRSVLAKFTSRAESVTDQQVLDFIRAAREVRAMEMRRQNPSTAREQAREEGTQSFFDNIDEEQPVTEEQKRDPASEQYVEGATRFSSMSRDTVPIPWSQERENEYRSILDAPGIPESQKAYTEVLANPTHSRRVIQTVAPMVDFARAKMGSYWGEEVEVNPENTERVKALAAQAWNLDPESNAAWARELSREFRESGFAPEGHPGSVTAGVLQMEILNYAVKLAAEAKDLSLALALMPYANDVAMGDHFTASNAGRALHLRSMAGQAPAGFWSTLKALSRGQTEAADIDPAFAAELRELLYSNDVAADVAEAMGKDADTAEGKAATEGTETSEEVDMEEYFKPAISILEENERRLATEYFQTMSALNDLVKLQLEMAPQQAASGMRQSLQPRQAMEYRNDPAALQAEIDRLKAKATELLAQMDKAKTSSIPKKDRKKLVDSHPQAKKVLSADEQAKKMLDALEKKPTREKKNQPSWRKAYEAQIKTPKSEAEFAAELAKHDIGADMASKLFDQAQRQEFDLRRKRTEADRRRTDRKETQQAISEATERVSEQKREMGRPARIADKKSFLNELVRQIFSGTMQEQSSHGWKRQIMIEAFKKEGFSQGSAENAADYLQASFDKHISPAQVKASQQAAESLKSKKISMEKFIKAIRAQSVDPLNADPVTRALAEAAGFKGITPEQFQRLAELDVQMKSPHQTLRAAAAAEVLKIVQQANMPKSAFNLWRQSWTYSALSSTSTIALSGIHAAFIPARKLVFDYAGVIFDTARGKTKPADAVQIMVNMLGNMQHAASYMLATAKYAGLNDVYTQKMVVFLDHLHSLQVDLQKAAAVVADPTATAAERGTAALKVALASSDIVRRILSTADETWGTMIQDLVLRNEAMRRFTQDAGYTPAMVADIFVKASDDGRAAGEAHRNATGNELEAKLVERDATQHSILRMLEAKTSPQVSQDVRDTAELEAPMELGNRRPETAARFDFVQHTLEWVKRIASMTKQQYPLVGDMLVGFVTVPANVLNRSAYFTPWGMMRYLSKTGKLPGWLAGDPVKVEKAYEESMKTEGQQRMRLIESITGTLLMVALIAFKPDKDEDGLVVTGAGPKDKGLKEAWLKKGNRPNSIQWRDAKGNVRWAIPAARGGFDHLNLLFTLVGTLDDMELQGIKPQPANVRWSTQYAKTVISGLADQARFFGLKNVAAMPSQMSERSLASQAAYMAAPFVPFSGFTKAFGRMWTGPTDQSSVESAIYAQLPFTNFTGRPSLNALGDQRGPSPSDQRWDRAAMNGIPFFWGTETKGKDQDVYDFMIKRGIAPQVPYRSTLERKNGFLEDQVWEKYLKTRGQIIKDGMRKNMRSLNLLEHAEAQSLLERITSDATVETKKALKLK